jgi:hypothetical protein
MQIEVHSLDNHVKMTKLSQADGLPSWVCDWRKEGLRPVADIIDTTFFHMLKSVRPRPPLRQSVYDHSNRLALMGFALARVGYLQAEDLTIHNQRLGSFSKLPNCGLQKAIGENGHIHHHSEFLDFGIKNEERYLPQSNMAVLLLQTMIHDRTGCGCDGKANQHLLKASCTALRFPRSNVKVLDWLFLLDGSSTPVILRPHIIPGKEVSDRGEVGFEFVSALPLEAPLETEGWIQSPFAYGKVYLY